MSAISPLEESITIPEVREIHELQARYRDMRNNDGMSALERSTATQEIHELQALRCYALDHEDWRAYEALHAPDHVSHSHDEQRREGAKENVERVAASRKGITSMHHLHSPIIMFESPTKASGIWSMEDHLWWRNEGHWLHGWGFYYEKYEKRNGKWLFIFRSLQRHKIYISRGATSPLSPFTTSEEIDAKFV